MATTVGDEPQWKTILRQCLPADCPLLSVVVGSLDPANDISDMSSPRNATAWHQAVERYLTHLNNELDSVTTERDRLTTERDILRTVLSPSATRNTGTPRRQSENPEKFSAKEKDTEKRQLEYLNWRSKVARNMAIDKAVFATEFQRIQYVGSMLTGDAYDLVREALDTIVTIPETPADWEWESATGLFEFLDTQYATQDLDRSAGQKFDLLQMTNKPYQNFIAEFEKLAQLAGKTPEQKVAALRMKVSREIMAVIMYRPNKPKKNQWPEWRTFCQEIYNDLEDDKHYTKLRNRDSRQPPDRPDRWHCPRKSSPTPDPSPDRRRPHATRQNRRPRNPRSRSPARIPPTPQPLLLLWRCPHSPRLRREEAERRQVQTTNAPNPTPAAAEVCEEDTARPPTTKPINPPNTRPSTNTNHRSLPR